MPPATKSCAIMWFREDLRLADNPALRAAVASKHPMLCVFVLDDAHGGPRARGGAALWWLYGALATLSEDISAKGGALHLFHGDSEKLIVELAQKYGATDVFWNRRYDAEGRAQDALIEKALGKTDIAVETFNGKLLVEPDAVTTKSGTSFRVYTPFWKALSAKGEPASPQAPPRALTKAALPNGAPKPLSLDALGLLPSKPDWAGGLRQTWEPGEAAAKKRLHRFADDLLGDYAKGRDLPAQDATSRLSPYLASGEISPRQIWHAAHHAAAESGVGRDDVEKLSKELAWREFSYHLLFHHPDLATKNFNKRFDNFVWTDKPTKLLRAWQKGSTGYPIVDAGMRQLWQTGWMHNRVRLITGSFLVKHLRIDWRKGEDWFWDTLVDSDPANNAQNWQWITGSGADAAPYFRIFNPVLQGERFDPDGDYVKSFVPELKAVPKRFIHKPWDAPEDVLAKAGVSIGKTYPAPIVDHARARAEALAAFAAVKSAPAESDSA